MIDSCQGDHGLFHTEIYSLAGELEELSGCSGWIQNPSTRASNYCVTRYRFVSVSRGSWRNESEMTGQEVLLPRIN